MLGRGWFSTSLALLVLATSPLVALAQRDRGVRDMAYTSPSWGYHVRWYGDEWTVDQESSDGGNDNLWLTDASGSVIGFNGESGYGGDAVSCLQDMYAQVQAIPGASDIEVVSDEAGTVQVSQDPWWSWAILLVGLPVADHQVDHVIYLDCRTLVAGKAVLKRTLATPAATFYEHYDQGSASFPHFGVLDASLPRSAWTVDPQYGHLMAGESGTSNQSVFFDHACGAYPHEGKVAFGADGNERAMMTTVDGPRDQWSVEAVDGTTRIVLIENVGNQPLTMGPNEFLYVDGLPSQPETQDVTSPVFVWEDTGGNEERQLAPGALTLARMTWPTSVAIPNRGVYLVYRDAALAEDAVVDSLGGGGGCGGGNRPKIRLSR